MRRSLSGIFVQSFAVVIVLLLTVIVGCFSITWHQNAQRDAVSAADALSDTTANLQDKLQSMIDSGNIIADHPDVYSFMTGTPPHRLALRDSVRSLLTTFVGFEQGVVNAYLFTADGAHLSAAPQRMEQDGSLAAFVTSHRVWRDEALSTPFRQARFSRCYTYRGNVYYALCTPVYPDIAAPRSQDYAGALILVLQADALDSAIPDSALENILITDGDLLLTRPAPALLERWQAGEQLLTAQLQQTGWTVCAAVPRTGRGEAVRQMGMLCLIIAAAATALLGALMMVQYRSIVGPIIDLAGQMDAIDRNEVSVINPSRGRHELNRLTGSLNSLLLRMHQLNEEMTDVKLKSYEEHITFLQAQINPHFLYNSFESIRGMAGVGDAASVREMASCMAAIYRYCCKGEPRVPLQQEMECLERYTRILCLRHAEQYAVELHVQQDALACFAPRMILQPLVENAVSHGFVKAGRRQGRVLVEARQEDDDLILTVEDDGAGMSGAQLAQYNHPAQMHDDGTHSHIGITNVMRRLQLLYGGHAAMRFAPADGGGLRIVVRIPQSPEKWTS